MKKRVFAVLVSMFFATTMACSQSSRIAFMSSRRLVPIFTTRNIIQNIQISVVPRIRGWLLSSV